MDNGKYWPMKDKLLLDLAWSELRLPVKGQDSRTQKCGNRFRGNSITYVPIYFKYA